MSSGDIYCSGCERVIHGFINGGTDRVWLVKDEKKFRRRKAAEKPDPSHYPFCKKCAEKALEIEDLTAFVVPPRLVKMDKEKTNKKTAKKKAVRELFFAFGEKKAGRIVKNEHYNSQEFLDYLMPRIRFNKQKELDKLYNELVNKDGTKLKFTALLKREKVARLINLFFEYGKHTSYWAARQTLLDNAHGLVEQDNFGRKKRR